MSTGGNIRRLREARGLTQRELAQLVGVSDKAVSTWELDLKSPRMATLQKLAAQLGVTGAELLAPERGEAEKTAHNRLRRIPVLRQITLPLKLDDVRLIEGYAYIDGADAAYFGLRVRDDAMAAARIHRGDLLIVRHQPQVANGEIAVVLAGEEEAVVRRFFQQGHIVTLVPQAFAAAALPRQYDLRRTRVVVVGKAVENRILFEEQA